MIERVGLRRIGIFFAVMYWPLEAGMHTFVFSNGTFLQNLLPTEADELWMRSLISLAFILFGIYGQRHVDELKSMQENIQLNRNRLQQVIDSAYDAYVAINKQGEVIGWNRSAEVMFGWPVGEALGKSLTGIIIPKRYHLPHQKGMKRYLDSSVGPWLYKPVVTEACHRDGHEFTIEMVVSPLVHNGDQEFFAFIRKQ